MPTLTIQCDNCNNREEVTLWEADSWARRCRECTDDACPNCADPDHREHHPKCWEETQAIAGEEEE